MRDANHQTRWLGRVRQPKRLGLSLGQALAILPLSHPLNQGEASWMPEPRYKPTDCRAAAF
jgi:hypothetical protein